jgi:CheY-like chemotaxis protein
MALILVAEDDMGTRKLLAAVLERSGHDVLQAEDGHKAWSAIRTYRPDVVVSDVNMPGMSGTELLDRVRTHQELALTPVILLTSLQERRDVRLAMSKGADDYIGKPFVAGELLDAVAAQLNRNATRAALQDMQLRDAVDHALQEQARQLGDEYEQRLATALSEQWPGEAQGQQTRFCPEASVLCVRLEPVRQWASRLEPVELARLFKRFHECVGDTVYLFGAVNLQGAGEQLVALFDDRKDNPSAPHLLRALKAAFALRQAEATLDAFGQRLQTGHTDMPSAAIRVGLHLGPVALTSLEGLLGGAAQAIPVGRTVLEARDLADSAIALDRRVMVSVPVMRRITGAVRQLDRQLVIVPGRDAPLDACAVEPVH